MRFVNVLKDTIAKAKIGQPPDQWIKNWLFKNPHNDRWSIPHDAHVTLIVGIHMLFEFPYRAICDVVSTDADVQLAPYICVSDVGPTEILILDMETSKIVFFDKLEAWKFRFKNLKALDDWMRDQAVEIAKKMGRTVVWQKLKQT